MTEKFQIIDMIPDFYSELQVAWDEYLVGEGKDLIWTGGLGTCLAVTLYDPSRKKGAMVHVTRMSWESKRLEPRMVVDNLLKKLNGSIRINPKGLELTLAGEGLIKFEDERISQFVKKRAEYYGIQIIGEDLCRDYGRMVFLYCDTGLVEVCRTFKILR